MDGIFQSLDLDLLRNPSPLGGVEVASSNLAGPAILSKYMKAETRFALSAFLAVTTMWVSWWEISKERVIIY